MLAIDFESMEVEHLRIFPVNDFLLKGTEPNLDLTYL